MIFAMALPLPAWAEVCDKIRPDWDGKAVTAVGEALYLFSTVPSLTLMIATAFAIRFRNKWGALVVVVLWSIYATVVSFADPTGVRDFAIQEGCVGPNTLFIVAIGIICVGLVLYTSPRAKD